MTLSPRQNQHIFIILCYSQVITLLLVVRWLDRVDLPYDVERGTILVLVLKTAIFQAAWVSKQLSGQEMNVAYG